MGQLAGALFLTSLIAIWRGRYGVAFVLFLLALGLAGGQTLQ